MENTSTVEVLLHKWHDIINKMIEDARKSISKYRPVPFEIRHLNRFRIWTMEQIQGELNINDSLLFNNVKYSIIDCNTFPEEHKKYFKCDGITEEGRTIICSYLDIVINPDTVQHYRLYLYYRLILLFMKLVKQGHKVCCEEMKKIDQLTGLKFEPMGDLDAEFNSHLSSIMNKPELIIPLLKNI
jgi:hypothetical protein